MLWSQESRKWLYISATLEWIYDHLPPISCKKLCHDNCSIVPVSKVEAAQISRVTGRAIDEPVAMSGFVQLPVVKSKNAHCGFLDKRRTCSIHSFRPLLCRLYGIDQKMKCPHGCVPKQFIEENKGTELFMRIDALMLETGFLTKGEFEERHGESF